MNCDLKEKCKDIRCDIMTCIGHLGVGHIGGCLSIVELLAVLYFQEMNIDPAQPKMPGRDRLVCSSRDMLALRYTQLSQTAATLTRKSCSPSIRAVPICPATAT